MKERFEELMGKRPVETEREPDSPQYDFLGRMWDHAFAMYEAGWNEATTANTFAKALSMDATWPQAQPYLSYWPDAHAVRRADGFFKCSCGSQASDINMTHNTLPQHAANHKGEPVCQRMIAWHDGATKCMNPRWAHQGLGHDFQENE